MYGKNLEGGLRAAVVWDIRALGSSRVSAGRSPLWVGPYKAPQLSGRQEAGFSISCIGEQIIQAQGQTKAQVSAGFRFSYSVGNGAAGHGGFLEMHPRPQRAKKPDTLLHPQQGGDQSRSLPPWMEVTSVFNIIRPASCPLALLPAPSTHLWHPHA